MALIFTEVVLPLRWLFGIHCVLNKASAYIHLVESSKLLLISKAFVLLKCSAIFKLHCFNGLPNMSNSLLSQFLERCILVSVVDRYVQKHVILLHWGQLHGVVDTTHAHDS